MLRTVWIRVFVLLLVLAPLVAHADAYDDLLKAQAAFRSLKSWHADELPSNGKVITVDFVAPDRWRIQPNPQIEELLIGNDLYMVRDGKSTKLPFGGQMAQKMIESASFSVQQDVKNTARDLGMQTVDGVSLHAYSFDSGGSHVTLYLDSNSLPQQSLVQSNRGTMTIKYSKFNEPITIEP